MNSLDNKPDDNLDPITGTPGAHPTGTGVGAASGGVMGAAVGAVAGPIGMALGAAVGTIAGGLVGKVAAESMNPTADDAGEREQMRAANADAPTMSTTAETVNLSAEENYWRAQYASEPYYVPAASYEDYAPAYMTGYLGYARLAGNRYEDIESDLERDYSANRGASSLAWMEARAATRAAWDHVARP